MSTSARSLLRSEANAAPSTRASVALELVGIGVAAATLVLVGGTGGAVAATAVVLVWTVLPVEYTLAAGQVAFVAVAPDPVNVELLVGVQGGLGLLLAGALRTATASRTRGVAWLLAYVALGGGVWYVAVESGEVWYAVVLLWAVVAATAYGIHRHELVTLGLTEGEHHR